MENQSGAQKPTLLKRLLNGPIVHLTGVALVLNSINTYGFEFFFPKCTRSSLAASCYQYGSSAHFLESLGGLQVVNLLLRFMMVIGFGLDILAVAYLVFLCKKLFRSRPGKHPVAGV